MRAVFLDFGTMGAAELDPSPLADNEVAANLQAFLVSEARNRVI
jgi:hypothetical protein